MPRPATLRPATTPAACLLRFLRDESGAVTADYIVAIGGIIGISAGVMSSVGSATIDYGDGLGDFISGLEITPPGNPGNHKGVGQSGENPNRKGGWGSGRVGMSG